MFDFFAKKKAVKFDASAEIASPDSPDVEEILLKLNYAHPPTPILKVKISYDFKTAVFTDIEEKFIVEQKEGYTV